MGSVACSNLPLISHDGTSIHRGLLGTRCEHKAEVTSAVWYATLQRDPPAPASRPPALAAPVPPRGRERRDRKLSFNEYPGKIFQDLTPNWFL